MNERAPRCRYYCVGRAHGGYIKSGRCVICQIADKREGECYAAAMELPHLGTHCAEPSCNKLGEYAGGVSWGLAGAGLVAGCAVMVSSPVCMGGGGGGSTLTPIRHPRAGVVVVVCTGDPARADATLHASRSLPLRRASRRFPGPRPAPPQGALFFPLKDSSRAEAKYWGEKISKCCSYKRSSRESQSRGGEAS